MKYRIVEEGHAVYIQWGHKMLWFRFWNWDREYRSIEAGDGPRKNYGTLEAARQEVDRRRAQDAAYVDPPRVTEYPPAPLAAS